MRAMRDERVVGGAEAIFERVTAVLHAVDEILRMLDSHAELKRLLHHRHAATEQHLVSIAGTVTDRQHDERRSDSPRRRAECDDAAFVQFNVFNPALKAELAAERLDLTAQRFDDGRQTIAP